MNPSSSLHDGAQALKDLLRDVHQQTEAALADHIDLRPGWLGEDDPRDYPTLAAMVSKAMLDNLQHSDAGRREGFTRALAELLCQIVDGGGPSMAELSAWDPIQTTSAAFAVPGQTVAVIARAAALKKGPQP